MYNVHDASIHAREWKCRSKTVGRGEMRAMLSRTALLIQVSVYMSVVFIWVGGRSQTWLWHFLFYQSRLLTETGGLYVALNLHACAFVSQARPYARSSDNLPARTFSNLPSS